MLIWIRRANLPENGKLGMLSVRCALDGFS